MAPGNRRLREARAYVQEAMGLLVGREGDINWSHAVHLLDRVSDSIYYYLDAVDTDDEQGTSGKHEKPMTWPGRHTPAGQRMAEYHLRTDQ